MAKSTIKTRAQPASHHRARPEVDYYAGLPRHSPEEIDAIAREQGTGPITDRDALAGNFWPEDESCAGAPAERLAARE